MSDSTTHQPTLSERLASFFSRFRKVLLFSSGAILAAIIVAVVVSHLTAARSAASIRAAEQVQELWSTFNESEQETGVSEDDLREEIAQVVEEYPRTYGALRSRMILAELEWRLDNWQAAHDAYMAVVEEHGENHLTAPALFSAAAAAEESDNIDRARELYGRIADGEGNPTVEVPHALFNLGRLAETQSDDDLALEYYNRLVDEHGESNWTNLGRDRMIWITSQRGGADR